MTTITLTPELLEMIKLVGQHEAANPQKPFDVNGFSDDNVVTRIRKLEWLKGLGFVKDATQEVDQDQVNSRWKFVRLTAKGRDFYQEKLK